MTKRCKKIAKEFQGLPCFICNREDTTIGMHLLSVGSNPGHAQNRANIMPGCYDHHLEQEANLSAFVLKYGLEEEMEDRGFQYNSYNRKWFIPD